MPAAARPQGTAIHAMEDCHIDGINRHHRSITLRHADQLDVGRLDHGSVSPRIDAAMAALGATTLPSADAMSHSTFDAEVSISYVLEHHPLGIEK
jgi:hypothetical protein